MELLADPLRLSIIVPILNEARHLDQILARLFASSWLDDRCEVLLCDGGSRDDSLRIAANYPCRTLQGEPGRATQMNFAAASAKGRYLLFLHADSMLPSDFDPACLDDAHWGFFKLRLDHPARCYRVIESMINWRTGWSSIGGGDQALFFEREFFNSLGAYPAIPLMEDIEICRRARERASPRILDGPLTSSSRRWQKNGVVRTVVMMWGLRLAYYWGVDPRRLHRIYYPGQG